MAGLCCISLCNQLFQLLFARLPAKGLTIRRMLQDSTGLWTHWLLNEKMMFQKLHKHRQWKSGKTNAPQSHNW
jgi:hypothetical protein